MFKQKILEDLKRVVEDLGYKSTDTVISIPQNSTFGDYTTNLALQLAKLESSKSKQSPVEIANEIVDSVMGQESSKKYLEKAVNHFIQDRNWKDTAVELAEQILSVDQQVKVYLECHGPYEAITYAAEKKAYTAALEICEDHGFYDVGLGIATKVGNKKKAVLYGKILALQEHGDDVDDLERAIEKVKNRSEKDNGI